MLSSEHVLSKEEETNKNVLDAINQDEQKDKEFVPQPQLVVQNLLPKPICAMAKTLYSDFINVDKESDDDEEEKEKEEEKEG